MDISGDFMKSITNASRILGVVLGGAIAAGCDTVTDVRDAPATAPPVATAVLEGTITGLGVKRALYLDSGIVLEGHQPERSFFGSLDVPTVPFSYGSVPVGASYSFSVRTQPFGKICTISNASGTVGSGLPGPVVSCADDPAVPRYTFGGTATSTVANLPGATVILETEEGIERIALAGATSFQFTQRGFNAPIINPSNPAQSQFIWSVTATYTDGDRVYNCRVANGVGNNPTANVANVQVQACSFPVTGTVQYSAPPGGTDQPIGAGGVRLELRQLGDAAPDAAPATINAFSASTVTLWPEMRSYAGAAFDIVVAANPAGQACLVRTFAPSITAPVLGGGLTAVSGAMQGTTLWVTAPPTTAASSSHTWNPTGLAVRCRNLPAAQNQLTGIYQRIVRNTAATPQITTRQYLALFSDGTFLFASHGNAASHTSTGVEHGFYAYNPVAGTLDFNLWTDSSILGGTSATPYSLSNVPGFSGTVSGATGGVARATSVVKGTGNPQSLSFSFTGTVSGATVTSDWVMTEPKGTAGQMAGAWVPESDNRRLWVFNFDDTTGIHAGVNGPANLQDGCFVFDDQSAPSGYYTRRGGSTGCMTTAAGYASGFSTIDNAGRLSAVYPAGFFGRFPGTQSAADGRPPSPNLFEVIPGSPDTLVVQRTINGVPVDAPQRFRRAVIN